MGAKSQRHNEKPAAGVQVSQASFGTPIPVVFGLCRIPANLLYLGTRANRNFGWLQSPSSHGPPHSAGFGGAAAPVQLNFFYFVSMVWGLCEGPITGVRSIYKRDLRFRLADFEYYEEPGHIIIPSNFESLKVFRGTADQPPWLDDVFGVFGSGSYPWSGRDFYHPFPELSYPHLAYVARHAWPLYQQVELPNLTFEVWGLKIDHDVRRPLFGAQVGVPDSPTEIIPDPEGLKVGANPADIVEGMLTDPIYGTGIVDPTTGVSLLSATALQDYRTASKACAWILSLYCGERKPVVDYLRTLLEQSNATAILSNGELCIVPLSDSVVTGPDYVVPQHRYTHTPTFLERQPDGEYTVRAAYELTIDDFVADDEETITIARPNAADAFNSVSVEYLNRSRDFAPEIVEAQDLALIELYGRRDDDLYEAHCLGDQLTAQRFAQLRLQQKSALLNTYTFVLDWRYARLEPTDIVLLTHPDYDLNRVPVRIQRVEENEDEETLTIEATDFVTGLNTTVTYPRQPSLSSQDNVSVDPGKNAAPVLFEPVAELGNGALEVWIAVTGQSRDWGGCTVWMSEDGGIEYRTVGQIARRARIGRLSTRIFPSDPDCDVRMIGPSELQVELDQPSIDEAIRFARPVLIDAGDDPRVPYELVSYVIPALVAPNRYELRTLLRGGLGTPAQSHSRGANVVVIDDAILRVPIPPRLIAPTQWLPLRFKFTNFNLFGGEEQALEDVPEVSYRVTGIMLRTPVDPIVNLAARYMSVSSGSQLSLRWDPVADNRGVVEYEIRSGTEGWARATRLGHTRETHFQVGVDAVYWVAARVSVTAFGPPVHVYGEPASIAIKGSAELMRNVVQVYDEKPGQWASFRDAVAADEPLLWWRLGDYPKYPDVIDHLTDLVSATYTLATPDAQLFQEGAQPQSTYLENRCVVLQNSTDRISSTDPRHNLTGNEWTLFLFARRVGATYPMYLYSKGAGGAWLTIESTGRLRWLSAPSGTQLDGTTTISTDFESIALVYNKFAPNGAVEDRLTLYVDGNAEDSITGATFPVATGPTWLGNKGDPVGNPFLGRLDEFFKLTTALTAGQVESFTRAAAEYSRNIFRRFIRLQKPVLHYRFNEAGDHTAPSSAEDGPQYVGTYSGTIPPVAAGLVGGDADEARLFDDPAHYVLAAPADHPLGGGNPHAEPEEVTCEIICTPAAMADQYLFGWHSLSALNDGPYVELRADGSIAWHASEAGGGDHTVVTPPGAYQAGQRLHLVVTHGGGVISSPQIYVQGGDRTLFPVGGPPFSLGTDQTLFLRLSPEPGTLPSFNGVLDEFVIYPTRLSDTRIVAHADAVLGGKGITNLEVIRPQNYLRAEPEETGYFEVPDSHIVTLARHEVVRVTAAWDAVAIGPVSIREEPDMNAVGQVNVLDAADLIIAEPEISISGDPSGPDWTHNGQHPEWMPFQPGDYRLRRVRMRMKLGSRAAGVLAELRAFTWAVDVPDLFQDGTKDTSVSSVVHVTYPIPFHKPPALFYVAKWTGGPQQPGEFVRVTNETETGFDVEVVSVPAGLRLARTVTYIARGF